MRVPAARSHRANLKDLSMPFSEFELNHCEDADCGRVRSLLSATGYFDEIPAAYVLKYLDAFTVKRFLPPATVDFNTNGTQEASSTT